MANVANFYGYEFEADLNFFADLERAQEIPAVYVVYTNKKCLGIGETTELKTALETHADTRDWMKASDREEVYFAFYFDPLESSRKEIVQFLIEKMNPAVLPNS